MKSGLRSFLEGFVITAIVLVIVQTFLEDFSVLAAWSWPARRALVYSGFGFDLFFTVEFIARLYAGVRTGRGTRYLTRDRGWIDFVAAVPLLLLSSGPAVLSLATGGSFLLSMGRSLNMLKVIKAIRIARILRLLRVLKVFRQIKFADSGMAQRHLARITSIFVTSFVCVLFGASIGLSLAGPASFDDEIAVRNRKGAEWIAARLASAPGEATVREYTLLDPGLLIVKVDGATLYSKYTNHHYERNFGPSDYQHLAVGRYAFFFDLRPVLRSYSKDSLIYLAVIVSVTIVLLLFYSPHFAITVSDPINVMNKGMRDSTYNHEVTIRRGLEGDDVFVLADAFNRQFLPMKNREQAVGQGSGSVLKMEDLDDLIPQG